MKLILDVCRLLRHAWSVPLLARAVLLSGLSVAAIVINLSEFTPPGRASPVAKRLLDSYEIQEYPAASDAAPNRKAADYRNLP